MIFNVEHAATDERLKEQGRKKEAAKIDICNLNDLLDLAKRSGYGLIFDPFPVGGGKPEITIYDWFVE